MELKPLSPDDQPIQITRNEFMRRMKEMQALGGGGFPGGMGDMYNVVVNTNHPFIAEKLLNTEEGEEREKARQASARPCFAEPRHVERGRFDGFCAEEFGVFEIKETT